MNSLLWDRPGMLHTLIFAMCPKHRLLRVRSQGRPPHMQIKHLRCADLYLAKHATAFAAGRVGASDGAR